MGGGLEELLRRAADTAEAAAMRRGSVSGSFEGREHVPGELRLGGVCNHGHLAASCIFISRWRNVLAYISDMPLSKPGRVLIIFF